MAHLFDMLNERQFQQWLRESNAADVDCLLEQVLRMYSTYVRITADKGRSQACIY